MSTLYAFNPEHDYALAHGGKYYMPPASVRDLRCRLQLLPLIWSNPEDYILCDNGEIINAGRFFDHNQSPHSSYKFENIEPWGWDKAIATRIRTLGIGSDLIPTDNELENLRRLSHRRISIGANEFLNSPFIPKECFDEEETMEFVRENPGCYLKLPWSSGGRGVLATGELNESQIREWAHGAIRRQGSVMAEKGLVRRLDFASLWNSYEGHAIFEGFSLSISDGRGKYDGNVCDSQEKILIYIRERCPEYSEEIILSQTQFINKEIAPFYRGKMGIDMIGDREGRLYPCVEINLRRTMGHVSMDYYNLSCEKKRLLRDNAIFPGLSLNIDSILKSLDNNNL